MLVCWAYGKAGTIALVFFVVLLVCGRQPFWMKFCIPGIFPAA